MLILSLFPLQDAEEYLNRGTLKYGRGDYKGAVSEYTRAIGHKPELAAAWTNRGLARFQLKQYEKAIQDYTQAIQLSPDDAQIRYYRGHARHYHRDFENSVSDYTSAIRAKIGGADAFHYRGHAYRALGEYENALRDHKEGLNLDPESAWGHASRGYVEYDLGMPNHAMTSFTRAAKLNPPESDYLHLRIWLILARKKDRKEADHHLRNHLETKSPSGEDAWYEALVAFLLREKSGTQLLKTASGSEQKCEAWFFIGAVRLVENREKDAGAAFRACLQTNIRDFTEYSSAREELKRLDGRRK